MITGQGSGSEAPRKMVNKLSERTRKFEKTVLITTAVANKFNITDSAKEMGISRATYYRKLGKDGLRELEDMRDALYSEASSLIEPPSGVVS